MLLLFYRAHDLRAWELQEEFHRIIDQGRDEADEEVNVTFMPLIFIPFIQPSVMIPYL